MIWVVGIIGLIAGFIAGQALLLRLLKDRSRKELLTDKSLHLKYGLFNWLIAAGVCYIFVWTYQNFFMP